LRALGQQIAAPADFQADERWLDRNYLYLCDRRQGIIKRRPIRPSAGAGGYYRIASGRSEPPRQPGGRTIAPVSARVSTAATKPRQPRLRSRWKIRLSTTVFTTIFLGSILLLIYPYLPAATYQIHKSLPGPSQSQAIAEAPISDSNHLFIPKINVSASVLESSSLDILNSQEGVWHQTGNVAGGNLVLAGHRWKYLPPNQTTFYNLNQLVAGDVVVIDWLHKRYVYVVKAVQTVPATDVSVLDQVGPAKLTLYTCDDKKQTRRIVVTADPLP
jgi:LPXTG-site transpeptidase (sortase) family protein